MFPVLRNSYRRHTSFVKLEKYGRIFSVDVGSFRSVVVNDFKVLKQCLNDPAFSGRPKLQILLDRTGPGAKYIRGIGSEGRHWMETGAIVGKQFSVSMYRGSKFYGAVDPTPSNRGLGGRGVHPIK